MTQPAALCLLRGSAEASASRQGSTEGKGALFDGETLDAAHARLRAVVNAEIDGDIARDGLVNPEEGPSGGSFDQGGEREREGDD